MLGVLTSSVAAAAACGASVLRFGRSTGLLVGLLLASLPVHVAAGLSLDATAVVPATLALGWWLGERSSGAGKRTAVLLALGSGLLLSAAVLARYEVALLLPFLLAVWCMTGWRQRRGRALAGAIGVLAGALYFPTCGLLGGDLWGFYTEQLNTSALAEGANGLPPLTSLAFWSAYVALPVGIVGIPLALLGVWRCGRSGECLLVVAGLVSFAGFLVWRSSTTSLDPEGRYAYVLVAGVTVGVGVGGEVVRSWLGERLPRFGFGVRGLLLIVTLVALCSLAAVPFLPDRGGPATERGRMPVHEPEVRELMGAVEGLSGDGSVLFVDGPTDIPRQQLLIHARLGHQEEERFLHDLMSPSSIAAADCDEAALRSAAVIVADFPLDPGLDARLGAAGWSEELAGRWVLRFPPRRILSP